MVKAFRDTWHLGTHSYLSYLRDRLVAARELLADSGSLFVQIGDENLHTARAICDEVFGSKNFVSMIAFTKAAGGLESGKRLSGRLDFLVWYARDSERIRYQPLYEDRDDPRESGFSLVQLRDGSRRGLSEEEALGRTPLPEGAEICMSVLITKPGPGAKYQVEFEGRPYDSGTRWWGMQKPSLERALKTGRLAAIGSSIRHIRYLSDSQGRAISNLWAGMGGASDPVYVVQTNEEILRRCILMTTCPGDLVLDPTCGSGTTAAVAEKWGRRWITIDTSRVSIALARQRLLTLEMPFFQLREEALGPAGGFVCRVARVVQLGGIGQNTNLDPIFARHEPILEERLEAANAALSRVTDAVRSRLQTKLLEKQKAVGKRAVTDADRRRWELPKTGGRWEHWQVPFDTDPDWSEALRTAVEAYRKAWRAKMDEVNGCISANAEQEELVDQPEVRRGVVRVSGPFTVESVQPPEVNLGAGAEAGFGGGPEGLDTFNGQDAASGVMRVAESVAEWDGTNLRAYLAQMHGHLKRDGVLFLNRKQMLFSRLDPLFESGRTDEFHAEGRWAAAGETDRDPDGPATVGVVFGPQYGPVSARMVEEVIRPAARRYEDLVFAGFAFDGPAVEAIRAAAHPKLRIHMAHIRPDVNPGMAGLLKEQPGAQLFTVFGQPRVTAKKARSEWTVTMEGVDVYDPVNNVIVPTKADKVAAWFLDGDYDGRTFCITQAFFPDRTAWEKLARALKGLVDEERFAAMTGTTSLPFPVGKHRRAAVKVIDPRGNEVMTTVPLEG